MVMIIRKHLCLLLFGGFTDFPSNMFWWIVYYNIQLYILGINKIFLEFTAGAVSVEFEVCNSNKG